LSLLSWSRPDCPPLIWIYEEGTERLLWKGDAERLPAIGSLVRLHPANQASLPPKGKRRPTYPLIEARRVLGMTHVLVDMEISAKHRERIEIVVGALSNSGFGGC
jgi:hypothetical protein